MLSHILKTILSRAFNSYSKMPIPYILSVSFSVKKSYDVKNKK